MVEANPVNPAVAEFMRLIGETPLLDKKDEQALGLLIERQQHAQRLLTQTRGQHRAAKATIGILKRLARQNQLAAATAQAAGLTADPLLEELVKDRRVRRLIDYKIAARTLARIKTFLPSARATPSDAALEQQLAELSRDTLCLTDTALQSLLGCRVSRLGDLLRQPSLATFLKAANRRLARELAEYERAGADAQHRMSEANMRLVVSIARAYINNNTELTDLAQDGALGLLEAAQRFNHRLDLKFSTYATHWIRHKITKSLAQNDRIIRIPAAKHALARDVYYTREDLLRDLNREPTNAEVAQALNRTVAEIDEIDRIDREPDSLDAIIFDDSGATELDRIAYHAPGTEEAAIGQLLRPDLIAALSILSERERRVIVMRYGLADDCQTTVSDIAARLHTSKEKARRLEQSALAKLRASPAIIDRLSGYL